MAHVLQLPGQAIYTTRTDINVSTLFIVPREGTPMSKQSRHSPVRCHLAEDRQGWVKNMSTVVSHSAENFTTGGALLQTSKSF